MMRRFAIFCTFVLAIGAVIFSLAHAGVRLDGARDGQAAGAGALQGGAPRTQSNPILVELFTSQGCSSCPPADDVLSRLTNDPGVIAITRNVTYWDRLGWRDSLGRAENTSLQQRYAARGVAGGQIYTPAAVVNGVIGIVGSRETALRRAINEAALARRVALFVSDDRVSTPVVASGSELRFIALAAQRSINIGSGENGGRRLRYHNVVLTEAVAPCPANVGCAARMPAHVRTHAGADRWAVVLQGANGGPVRAARWMPATAAQ